jgi:hypothetical protein
MTPSQIALYAARRCTKSLAQHQQFLEPRGSIRQGARVIYIFVCDPDECDARIDFHARDGFGFPNGEVKMTCPCGRKMQYISLVAA